MQIFSFFINFDCICVLYLNKHYFTVVYSNNIDYCILDIAILFNGTILFSIAKALVN